MEKLSELVAEKHGRTIRALRRQMRDGERGVSDLPFPVSSFVLSSPRLSAVLRRGWQSGGEEERLVCAYPVQAGSWLRETFYWICSSLMLIKPMG